MFKQASFTYSWSLLRPAIQPIAILLIPFIVLAPGVSAASELSAASPTSTANTRNAAGQNSNCDHYRAEKQVFWGDLHVHTRLSMDAWSFGTRLAPSDAYRFARGESVQLASGQQVQLERPLDFAATTDHASDAGATRLCNTPGSPSYDTPKCQGFRKPITFDKSQGVKASVMKLSEKTGGLTPGSLSSSDICGDDGALCLQAERNIWQDIQRAAASFNNSDDCSFSTFVAYEYTANPQLTKIHRNVIFKNDTVIDLPISYVEEPDATQLWKRLKSECIDADTGCDVLAIPHNSNLSNGHLFTVQHKPGSTVQEQAELAALRAAMEPVVEMMQMKGDSECRNGMWNVLGDSDELCNWEKLRLPGTKDCINSTEYGSLVDEGCVSRLDFARYALVEGIKEKQHLGNNPYQFGFIGSTDTHNATPGATEEWRSDIPDSRANPRQGRNPGGMVAIWAEQNRRENLFDALRSREVYATSGPRIELRMFAAKQLSTDLCSDPNWVNKAYQSATPMGGVLKSSALQGQSPHFIVAAKQDPGTEAHPGNPLQRIQMIKGWTDKKGRIHQQVVDIAGNKNSASVNTNDCSTSGPGHSQLCTVWSDPNFDPAQDAVYYARVVENPSCRSTGWACALSEEGKKPSWCEQLSTAELSTQERAWSSPIWYEK